MIIVDIKTSNHPKELTLKEKAKRLARKKCMAQ
jgi:hypothetical protein